MTNKELAEKLLERPEMPVVMRYDYPGETMWHTETSDEVELSEKDGRLVIDLI